MKNFEIKLIPVSEIRVVNSRTRRAKKYDEIKKSVQTLGLKNPILVAPRISDDGRKYDLICGEGRLNIYIDSNEELIPARIVDCDKKTVLLMGLVENMARRQGNPCALPREVKRLRADGFTPLEIADKLGLGKNYIYEISSLIERGEEKIVDSIVNGHLPLSVGIKIANCTDNPEEQKIIGDAYNSGEIKSGQIGFVQRLIERRKLYGKNKSARSNQRSGKRSIVEELVRDVKKRKDFIERARICETKLAFVKGAFREFTADEGFMILLRAENITTFPSIFLNNG